LFKRFRATPIVQATLDAVGHVVESSPRDHQDLLDEVVDVGVGEWIGPSSEVIGHGRRAETRHVPKSIFP
jgi:hypothetical protein